MVRNNKRPSRVLKRDFNLPRPNEWDQDRRKPKADGSGYEEAVQSNAVFEEYYQKQGIVPEGEWDDFLASLRTPLPITFRINGTGKFAADLRDKLDKDFFSKLREGPKEIDGEALEEPQAIPWYPNKLAWKFTYSRAQVRKNQALSELHELLKRENTSGGITRQEAVSMAPPLFMDIQSHHKILDTCASPGSKTAQMLEMLHEHNELPTGFVIANDLEPQRCNLLVHQTKRVNSPALIVTNHDASTFPLVAREGPKEEAVYLDRILCDVPCSGDGTLRKAPDIWRRWTTGQGTGLHSLQVRITLHAASLLKIGGRMVYSTCSLNPIEDEAVVAEVLRQAQGALELLDVSDHLPDFKRCKGLRTWFVRGSKASYFTAFREAKEARSSNSFSPSMFPDEASNGFPLDRCMRVLPHHGDTGGFFIAVFQKRADLPPLQPNRWRKFKNVLQERRKLQHCEESGLKDSIEQNQTLSAGEGSPPAEAPAKRAALSDKQPPQDMQVEEPNFPVREDPPQQSGASKPAQSRDPQEGSPPFGEAMEGRADDAAQAAVVFADAVADEDVHAATDAAEDAADAAEDVADCAEDRAPREESVEEESVAQNIGPERENSGKDGHYSIPSQQGEAKRKWVRPGDEPLRLFTDKEALQTIVNYYGLNPNFPLLDQLVMRLGQNNTTGPRKLYYISKGVREVLVKDAGGQLKIASAGLRVFDRNDKKDPGAGGCSFRIVQDALPLLLQHLTKQLLCPTATEMLRLLKEKYVALPWAQHLPRESSTTGPGADDEPAPPASNDTSSVGLKHMPAPNVNPKSSEASAVAASKQDSTHLVGEVIEPKGQARRIPLSDLETIRQIETLRGGCVVCVLREGEAKQLGLETLTDAKGNPGAEPIAAVCWRGLSSLSLMVDKNDANRMAEKLEAAIQSYAASHAP